jgi:hypothetical protein
MFESLAGRPAVRQYLTEYIGKPPYNPILLTGPEGSGKEYIADLLIRHILCEGDKTETCTCQICQNREQHILRYRLEKNSWGVADIRTLVESIKNYPVGISVRPIIFNNAEAITSEGCDAFLKAVEENKDYNIFIFLSESKRKVVPALASRCFPIYIPWIEGGEMLGNPSILYDKEYARWEASLAFLESLYAPGTLLKIYKTEMDVVATLRHTLYYISQYLTKPESLPSLKSIFTKYNRESILVVYYHLGELISKLNRYPNLRAAQQLFSTVIRIKTDISKCSISS